ncbi:hypothetical protein F0562_031587 [Nyssa sinensis]|uniref:Uncharacterized protein n=1 Tax=Nyssa sinensis TaxID=561372 RepID=A0A5J5AVB3_9ASTE|nr:hypothetical protein F0562_031587 [Nyssa sinensis]
MVAQLQKSFELRQGFEHELTSKELTTTEQKQSIHWHEHEHEYEHEHEHEHEFELQSYEKRFPCNGCKEDGFGSRHRCKYCDYELHNESKNPKRTISHDLFKGYTFTLFEKLPKECGDNYCKKHASYCSACGKEICGFVYHCEEKGWNLHPCCSRLPTQSCMDGVNFELRNKASSNCMWCNQKVVRCSSKSVPGWSYFCTSEPEGYQFHVYCVSEMVHEAWKKGAVGNIDSNALKKISLRLVVNSERKDRKSSQILTTLAILLRTIVASDLLSLDAMTSFGSEQIGMVSIFSNFSVVWGKVVVLVYLHLLYYFGRFHLPATLVRHLFESKGSCKLLRQEEAYFGLSFSMESTKTFDLKVNIGCQCDGCEKNLKKLLTELGVKYDINLQQEKVTISGTVDPETIIVKIKKEMKKTATLWPKKSPPALNNFQTTQSIRRPTQSIRQPTQSTTQSIRRPSQSIQHKHDSEELTQSATQSIRQPTQSIWQPTQSATQSIRRPSQSIRHKHDSEELTQSATQSIRQPTQSIWQPTQSIRRPSQSIWQPTQSATQSIRRPSQSIRHKHDSEELTQSATQSIRRPSQSIRHKHDSEELTQSATQSIRQPTQSIWQPTQSATQSIRRPTQSIRLTTQSIWQPTQSATQSIRRPTQSIRLTTQSLRHEHEFELQSYKKRFPCDGCKEDGFGSRHRCKYCDYELHNECKNPKPTISHDFFKGYTFTFFEKLPKECGDNYCKKQASYCSACGKEICGFVYHCEEKGWNLHPCCSRLPTKRSMDGVSFELRNKASSNCMRCNQKVVRCSSKSVPGWSYVCTSEPEGYQFHVYCVTEMVHEAWKKGAVGNIDSDALKEKSLRLVVNSNWKDKKGSLFWRILPILLRTVVGILLGDPTAIFASFFELVSK